MATIAEILDSALKFHQRGDLAGAERLYREILDADPRNPDAWHLLGLIAHARGDFAAALAHIGRAIQLDGRQPGFHHHRAEVYRSMGKWTEAELCCRQALRCKSDFAAAHLTLGAILQEQGKLAEAIASFRQGLAHEPDSAAAHYQLGAALHALGRSDEAIACYRRALALQSDYAAAHCNLGSALQDRGQWAEAEQCYRRALESNPLLAEAHFNLGMILQRQGRRAEAAQCYRDAIRGKPDFALAYNNWGALCKLDGDLGQAIECYQRALEFKPNFAEALNNLGNVLKTQGRFVDALVCYDQTLRINPDHAQARYNRSLMDLAAGDFAAAWPHYEWRRECPGFAKRPFSQPTWRGEPLAGRRLLVHAEQGLGDTLQFVRYVLLLAKRDESIVLEVPKALLPLFEQSGFRDLLEFVAAGSALGDFDVHVPLLSLPGIFGTTLESIPQGVPYLAADPRWVDVWRDVLGETADFRVGIAWQGSAANTNDRFRSIRLLHFEPLARQGVELISLQKGPGSEQLAGLAASFNVRHFAEGLDEEHGAFVDTSAIMKNLDLVVTADTAVAHLAGALGVAVWVALPLATDWRWMRDRHDSPWYPTMRLFRQPSFDDWPSVFRNMAEALRCEVAKR
jgi:tetratricopeptide (TPR) repeat protein